MKLTKIFIAILIIATSACSNPSQKLNGRWKEFYAAGQNTDVSYNDIYQIKVNAPTDIKIICETDSNQVVSKILFDSEELTLEINSHGYKLPYKLKFKSDEILEGETITIRGESKIIKWQKIK